MHKVTKTRAQIVILPSLLTLVFTRFMYVSVMFPKISAKAGS